MTTEQSTTAFKNTGRNRFLLILGLGLLLVAEGYFGYRLHTLSKEQEELKIDYTDANSITRGLFSVEQWRDKVAGIVNHQVRHFTLTRPQKKALQTEVQEVILALIDQAEALLNKKPATLGGKLKRLAVKTFVNTDKIKAQAPSFAKMIIARIDNPANKNKLSDLALNKFSQAQQSGYLDSTIRANDVLTRALFGKYHVSSAEAFNAQLTRELARIRTETYYYCFGMLACVLVVLCAWWFCRKRVELHATLFILSLLFAFMLLAVGLSASMVEVDARVGSLDFVLLGEHVVFKDQVLFFQSKSILDVVTVLIRQPAIDSIAVGALVLAFSILFPIMKLTATGIHLLSRRKLAENRVIKYFAFQSGKWSMADVIVIAILMTYIGLNGLLDSQLASLNIKSDTLTLITTNNTALQAGYIVFICFVLYGLILSTILKSITPYDSH